MWWRTSGITSSWKSRVPPGADGRLRGLLAGRIGVDVEQHLAVAIAAVLLEEGDAGGDSLVRQPHLRQDRARQRVHKLRRVRVLAGIAVAGPLGVAGAVLTEATAFRTAQAGTELVPARMGGCHQ